MEEVMKMLRALLNAQSAQNEEIAKLRKELQEVFEKLSRRIDVLGSDLAYLEDDAPTREEHDKLEKRVSKIENKLAYE